MFGVKSPNVTPVDKRHLTKLEGKPSSTLLLSFTILIIYIMIYVEVSRNAHNGETNAKKLITRPIITITSLRPTSCTHFATFQCIQKY